MKTNCVTSAAQVPATRHRSGHTLVELVVSVAVSGILVAGLTSTLYVASRAVNVSGPPRAVLAASTGAADVLGELHYAITFTERSANAVEFTVADRNADEAPETIRYAWPGIAGDPLTRQYNGGTIVQVLQDVRQFDLAYDIRVVSETTEQKVETESEQYLMASFTGWPGITPSYENYSVGPQSWIAEFFLADVPDGAKRLDAKLVQVTMRQGTAGSGDVTVGIHKTIGGGNPEPHSAPIGTPYTRSVSTLPTDYTLLDFAFSDVTISNPGKEYVIVVKGTVADAADIQYYYSPDAPADDPTMVYTTDGGSSWGPKKNARKCNDMPFYFYGTYTTESTEPVTVERYFVRRVDLTLRIGADASAHVDAAIDVLNNPEVASP